MKLGIVELLSSPSKDPAIGKKYLLTLASLALSFLLFPAVLLTGYIAETIKHASLGKKGLPSWDDGKKLGLQGAVCSLTGLYLLPGAIVIAISMLTAGTSSKTVLGASLLSTFISTGGLVLVYLGLCLATAGIHSYVHSGNFGDLFQLPNIVSKVKSEAASVGLLFGSLGIVTLVLSIANSFFGTLGGILSLGVTAFLLLSMGQAVGSIYGLPQSEVKALPKEEISLDKTEVEWMPADDTDNVWKPE